MFNNYLLESKELDKTDTYLEDSDSPANKNGINAAEGLYQSSYTSSSQRSGSPRIFDTGTELNIMQNIEDKRTKKHEKRRKDSDANEIKRM